MNMKSRTHLFSPRTFLVTILLVLAPHASAIDTSALFSSQIAPYMEPSEPTASDPVVIRLRTAKGDGQAAGIKYFDESLNQFVELSMELDRERQVGQPGKFDLWKTIIPPSPSRKWYRFWVRSGSQRIWYNAAGVTSSEPSLKDYWLVPDFKVPAWQKDAVIYQIFVDRFDNGDPRNDVKDGEYLYAGKPVVAQDWTNEPESPPWGRDFFGGDLAGVERRLETYLQQNLGIDTLYLNPIFKSPSNHKYDTQDYRQVDPQFGGNDALARLMQRAHSTADFTGDFPVRVILDGVFNHTGHWSPWFDKDSLFPEVGAFESQSSPYADWYTFHRWPEDYVGWQNFGLLPKLDYASQTLRYEMYEGPSSILKTWLQPPYAVDGWRFDVAEEIGIAGTTQNNKQILAQMRQSIKETQPDAAMIAEIWENAAPYLGRTLFDSVMNYEGFADPVSRLLTMFTIRDHMGTLKVSEFDRVLRETRSGYPTSSAFAMMNLIDSHDTSRFLTRAGGDFDALKMAATLQMTYIGSPMIYYGDEIAMDGAADPFNRRPFVWERSRWNQEVLAHYKAAIAVRKKVSSLRNGNILTLATDDSAGLYAFGRWNQRDAAVVALNLGERAATMVLPVALMDQLDGTILQNFLERDQQEVNVQNGVIRVVIPARSSIILGTP